MNSHEPMLLTAKESLGAFGYFMEPDYQRPAHIKTLIKKLKDVESGKIKRLIVNLPPRHGKSLTVSKLFPAWYLGRNPQDSIIFTTYGQDLADDFGRQVRNLIADEKYSKIFPETKLASDSSSIKRFAVDKGGSYFAVGAGGAITGRGGDCILIDDILRNRQDANSETIRNGIIDWFNSTLFTRLSPTGKIVLINTRWHQNDLTGYLLDKEPDKWEVLNLPAIDDEGAALWPERWNIDKLTEIKKTIGTFEFEALYQQNPIPLAGHIIKREWVQTYRELPTVLSYSWSWDTAIKAGEENDYSVGQLWAHCANGYYLVDMVRQRLEYPELRKLVNASFNKYKASEVLVEDKASGQQILQDFKRIGTMPVVAMMPGKSMPSNKSDRMTLVSPLFEAGKVFFPEDSTYLFDIINEITNFPFSKHDDICDAMTQYLSRKLARENSNPRIRTL